MLWDCHQPLACHTQMFREEKRSRSRRAQESRGAQKVKETTCEEDVRRERRKGKCLRKEIRR